MHNLTERLIREKLAKHSAVLGFDPVQVGQQSEEWFQMRLGTMTASKAKCIVAGATTDTRLTYMAELIAEVATGTHKEMVKAKALDWGNQQEPHAVASYEFLNSTQVDSVPLLYSDDMRCACSPDGVVSDRGLEIKCPLTTEVHIRSITDKKIKSDYLWQIQYSMFVSGLDLWDFGSFDPRMKKKNLHIITVERDDKMQKTLEDAIPQFISDMDKQLSMLGFDFGDQWICQE
ncbi:exonuclease [Marinomonas phage P12026]|uniref:exonuclease n=1 Tax=Marinomonas phage P12026 TaxID=1176423 RepID=UPI0002688FAD|nr:exonuclease [Marinomonas phage P12026]AFM54896.1 phage exonuclease [Marinomonas phage P12026]